MNSPILFSVILILFAMLNANAQDLSAHQWQDRLVLILTDDIDLEILKNQLSEFRSAEEEIHERKLVFYQIMPEKYSIGLIEQANWVPATNLYTRYKKSSGPFEVVLIGLDGGVKLRQTELLSKAQLFSIIDSMPMRRSELRKKKGGYISN